MKNSTIFSLVVIVFSVGKLHGQCTDPNAQFEFYTATPPIPTIFCEGGIVEIDNKCDETNPSGCIDHMTINWDFPNGAVQTFTDFGNRTHSYDFTDSVACLLTLPKTFTIELCVYYDQPGFDNCITKQVKVRPKPVARFEIEDPICINDPNQCVINNSCADSMWTWTFKELPNGSPTTSSLEAPCHNFNQLGQYQVTLIAKNSCGQDTMIKNTTVIDTIKAQGTISQFSGCGMVTVTLTDQSNNPPVVATSRKWTISPSTGWVFVDSTNMFSQIAKVKFTQPGDYTITLEVTGVCNTNTEVIGMVHLAGFPSAQMNGVNGGCFPHSITPTATNVNYANSNQNNGIMWQFPGGNPLTGTGTNPGTVQYSNPGTFNVIMTITNECGSVADTMQITVGQPADTNVQLNGQPASGCGPFTVTLNNTSVGGTPKWWITPDTSGAFSFANGTSSTSVNPQITFSQPGVFTLHFSLLGAGCGSDTAWASSPIIVQLPPVASLGAVPSVQCIPASVTPFSPSSNNGGDANTTCQWSFPGGAPSSSNACNPGTIAYPDTGQYTLMLIMQNACGGDTATASFYVADLSQVIVNAPDTVCSYDAPFTIQTIPAGGTCPGYPNCMFDPGQVSPGLHVIQYNFGSGNCMVSAEDSIFVADVNVDAGDNETHCDTLVPVYQLMGQSPAGGIFSGNGILNPDGQFSAAVAGFGTHTITYSYTDTASGCDFSGTKTITVFAPPTAAGSIPTSGCVGVPVDFNVTSAGVTQCWWKFGDSSPMVQECVTTHTYQSTGDFQVMLVVGNANGCKDTLMQDIHISQPATAAFSFTPPSGCAPLEVTFTNESTGENMQFFWDFGNGQTSTLDAPGTVTYQQGTTVVYYYPTLTVVNGCGDTAFNDTVEVRPRPIVDIIIWRDTICSGDTVKIQNNTLGNPLTFLWNDGKGNQYTTLEIPDQVYYTDSAFAEYFITLMATNDCGTDVDTVPVVVVPINFKAFFNLNTDSYCQYESVQITNGATIGTTVSYDFGDGTTSEEANPIHVYQQAGSYKIVQYARTDCGLDSMFQWVTVLPAPQFGFSYESEVCQNQPLTFFSNNDPATTTCEWDFGDGNSFSGCQPSHTYQLPGIYTVKLTVTDIVTGCSNIDSSNVLVRANPAAIFYTLDTVGCGTVTAHLVNGNDLPGYSHVWTFTPGLNSSVETNPVWLFDSAAWYSVTLLTTDDFGCYDDTTVFELVHVHPVPDAAFGLAVSENCQLPATLQTQNQSSGALGYSWQFSNSVQSEFVDTTLVFQQPGDFWVSLIALNEFQCADTASGAFTIHPEILADFQVSEPVQCARSQLEVQNLSVNTNNHVWQFSNGDTVTGDLPDYAFQHEGVYDIMLIASLDTFCYDTAFIAGAVEILPSPFAGFTVTDTVVFQVTDGTIVCRDSSIGAISWFYDFGDGGTSDERNPLHRYFSIGDKTILQAVENEWGCTDTAIVVHSLPYFEGLFIPNALMPDAGGGEFAVFQPKGVSLKTFKIEVFSPWGERVWFSEQLSGGQPSEHWDGTDPKGIPVPQGAYAWKVQAQFEDGAKWEGQILNGEKVKIIGSVTVIR